MDYLPQKIVVSLTRYIKSHIGMALLFSTKVNRGYLLFSQIIEEGAILHFRWKQTIFTGRAME